MIIKTNVRTYCVCDEDGCHERATWRYQSDQVFDMCDTHKLAYAPVSRRCVLLDVRGEVIINDRQSA